MGIPILRKGTDDGCCDCATVVNPCECGPKVTSTCRKRSGTASICGIETYESTTPPRRYHQEVIGGQQWGCSWNNTTCNDGPLGVGASSYFGSRSINPATCGETNERYRRTHPVNTTGGVRCNSNFDEVWSTSLITGAFNPFGGTSNPGMVVTSSPTSKRWEWDGDCYPGGGFSERQNGEVYKTLSDEDTEDDAIARSTASWSEWGEADNCCAGIQQRTSGLSFNFAEVEYKLNITGPVGEYVTIEIELLRRPYGSTGPFDPFASVFDAGTLDGEGKRELTGSIPCEVGYETCMGNVSVYNP